jgi:hypothetical protein
MKKGKTMKHARKDYNRIQDPANLIPADEPVFLLRAQDRTAAKVVRFWAWYNSLDADSDKNAIKLAESHADLMDKWPVKKAADV